jgi:hypothetical protein
MNDLDAVVHESQKNAIKLLGTPQRSLHRKLPKSLRIPEKPKRTTKFVPFVSTNRKIPFSIVADI